MFEPTVPTNSSGQTMQPKAELPQQQLGPEPQLQPTSYSVQTIPESQMDSIVNVTREYPFDYAIVMFGYLLPVVLFVTIVTNLLVVAVLYQRHMRTPTNIVLFTMAIVDLATLLSPSPWYLYIYTFGNHNKFLYPPIACYAHHIMTDVVPVFFHTSSIWLALLLASQRYIYVCHPTLARTWCTVPRVKRAILVILMIAFLHQLSRFFDNTFISVQVEFNHVKHMACKNEIAEWVHSIDVALYYTTYFTFRILFVFIIPCSALITLNWLLFRALKRAETKRTQLLKTKFKIVGVDPSRAERINSHHNLSVAAFGLGGTREVSSYVAPEPSCFVSQRGIARTKERLVHNEHTNCEEEEDEDDDGGGDSGEDEEEDDDDELAGLGPSRSPAVDGATTHAASPYLQRCRPVGLCNQDAAPKEPTDALGQLGDSQDAGLPARGADRAAPPARGVERCAGAVSLRSGSSASSNQSNSNSASTSTSKTDDLSTCPECAAYEAEVRRGCRGCSVTSEHEAGIDQGNAQASICEHHRSSAYHRHLTHQPISQCSSILGGATNTTTNDEDISSCLATQNISSSMFVPATIDGIETSSMRGADDDEAHELSIDCDPDEYHNHNSHHHHHQQHHQNGHTLEGPPRREASVEAPQGCRLERVKMAPKLAQFRADSDLGQLTKSGSVDSRLTCGCLSAQAMALRRVRSLGRQRRESPLARKRLSNSCKGGRHSCSALEDSASKKTQQVEEVHGGSAAHRLSSKIFGEARATNQSRGAGLSLGAGTPELANMESSGSLPPAGYHSAGAKVDEQRSEADETADHLSRLDLRSAIAAGTYQPATTTTTLYSANTSSAGSLLHVQASFSGGRDSSGKQTSGPPGSSEEGQQQSTTKARSDYQLLATAGAQAAASATQVQQRMKSPSFASCTTGRGSRATLLGATAMPMIVSGQNSTQNNIQAMIPVSTRSMDSNRTTLMLVVVVTVFLFVEVPVALMTIAHVVLNTFDVFKDVEFNPCLDYIKLFTNFMIMISYSVNFTIYCSMSKRFRETFRDLFYCGRSGARKRTKRIFSQSQAPHCTQINPHQFAASTMVTSAANHNHNSNHQRGGSFAARPSRQLGDSGIVASNSKQNLLGHLPRKPSDRLGQQSECEL